MVRGIRSHRRHTSRLTRPTPYPLPSYGRKCLEKEIEKKLAKPVKKDWEDAVCSVCMEFPHNAVLLLCSSYDKGCRPYMCGTSFRYSNCLHQFKKAYTKVMSPTHVHEPSHGGLPHISTENVGDAAPDWEIGKCQVTELACPLCRGQVKGWTVVEAARKYLNAKKRSCMQDDCSFMGTYKELRKHMRAIHPLARPREVDPLLEQNWKRLEHDREREDVLSTIRSSMPGAMVLGDYVIERGPRRGFDFDDDNDGFYDDSDYPMAVEDNNLFNVFLFLQAFGNAGGASFNSRLRRLERGYRFVGEEGNGGASTASVSTGNAAAGVNEESGIGRARIVGLGRSERRRRRRSRRPVVDVS